MQQAVNCILKTTSSTIDSCDLVRELNLFYRQLGNEIENSPF